MSSLLPHLLLENCLHYLLLLLLHLLLLCRLLIESLLHYSHELCRFHGFMRLSEQCAPLPCEITEPTNEIVFTTRSRSVASAHVDWRVSKCEGLLVRYVNTIPAKKKNSMSYWSMRGSKLLSASAMPVHVSAPEMYC